MTGKKIGDQINITVTRDGQAMIIPITLLRNPMQKNKIEELPNATPQQLAVRKKWLNL
jgi:hypothetical protein